MRRVACRKTTAHQTSIHNIAAFAIFVASAVGLVAEPPRPNLDRREQSFAAGGQRNERAAAEAGLHARVPNLVIERHPTTGSPRWISAREHFLTGKVLQPNPHGIVKRFVDENAAVFGHEGAALTDEGIARDYVTAHNGMRTIIWQQKVEQIPVLDAVFQAHVTREGELVNVASQFAANAHAAGKPAPAIDARAAIRIACTNLGEAPLPDTTFSVQGEPDGPTQRQRFRGLSIKGEADARLAWVPLNANDLRLCWDVILTPRSSKAMYRVLVDAATGEVWVRRNLTSDISNASYRVFTSDSPTPFSPGYSGIKNTNQPAQVSRQLVTLKALDLAASPEGWIPDVFNQTFGNNVDAHTDLDDDDQPDTPRPVGAVGRVFDINLDLTQEPTSASYRNAAVVNLFYWCNWLHDRLYQLGFTEAAGNFQANNFGKGGEDGDRVLADAQDGGGTNNANFATPPDGHSPRMQMYRWNKPTPDRDGDFDTEIMIHEYVHGLAGRLVGGGVGITEEQSGGLGEGWSDFYALALLSQSGDALGGNYALGAYAAIGGFKSSGDNYYFGLRRFPYSTNLMKNPLTFSDIDHNQAAIPSGVPYASFDSSSAGEVHNVGEIWCSMLWEARAKLIIKHGFSTGNELSLQLVTDGMKLTPANPTFVEARDAIIQADQVLTGGANKNELWAGFAKRGLGIYASAPPNFTTTGVFEDFSMPDTLRVFLPTDIHIAGAFGGPFNFTSTNYLLSNASPASLGWSASVQAPLAVSLSSGTLAVNGKQTVTVSVNSAGAAALPIGTHERFVTFSNKVSHVVHKRRFTFHVTEPLVLEPDYSGADEDVVGPAGGPFEHKHYGTPLRVVNHSVLSMSWTALTSPFITVTPTDGVLAGQAQKNLQLGASAEAAALPYGDYTSALVISNLTTGVVLSRPVHLRVRNDGYLTEAFDYPQHPMDLAGKSLTFIPDGSEEFYTVCVSAVSSFPTDPSLGRAIDELDGYVYSFEDYAEVVLDGGKTVSLYGQQTNRVWVHADGSVTLNEPDYYSSTGHFDRLRVSGLRGDYDEEGSLAIGARVSWRQLSDRIAITWEKLLDSSGNAPDSTNNFQVELFFEGALRITILSGAKDGIVGLSRGTNFPSDFISTDFSAKEDCANVLPKIHVSAPSPVNEGQALRAGVGIVWVAEPVSSPLTVNLVSSDTTELLVPGSVSIPTGATSAVFNITVVNDSILDGTKPAVITASAALYTPGKKVVLVQDNEMTTLHLSTPLFVEEGTTNWALLWSEAPVAETVTVNLSSTNGIGFLPFPYAFLQAGSTSTMVQFKPPEDQAITGTRLGDISASVANWTPAKNGLLITDNEETSLTIFGPLVLGEAGAGIISNIAQVRISGTLPTNLTVNLSVSGGGFFEYLAYGPVTIPAGETNAFFHLSIVDDNQIEPLESFQITASAPGFLSGSWTVFVFDNDSPPEPMNPYPPHLAEDVPLNADLSWGKTEGELVVNGGFEDVTLAGWTRVDSGGGGWISATASHDPPGPESAQPPLSGIRFALSQQYGNGKHELWQDVAIPDGLTSAILTWSHRLHNHAPAWATNQQFRVELRDTDNNVLSNLFLTQAGQPLSTDWSNRSFNLHAWRGQTVRLAFVEVDELGSLAVSLDSVSIVATPPAPTTWLVYLGLTPAQDGTGFLGSTTNTSFLLATLPADTTFYWYVKSVRSGATNTGPVWQFTTTSSGNLPPTLSLGNPGHNAIITAPAAIPFSVASISDDGVISKVEFWASGTKLGEDPSAPYSFAWTNAPLGEHSLWAVAQDSLGARATSSVHRISVIPASGILKTLVPFGAEWSYEDTGANLGTAWRSNSFNAAQWARGPAQLGYGEADEATTVDFGNDPTSKHVTTYFRHEFELVPGIQSLQLRVLRDDGVAVYLNGREVVRNNLGAAAGFSNFANSELTAADEAALVVTNVARSNFTFAAASVVAAEIHQASAASVDLSFDLELSAVVNPPPTISLVGPANGSIFNAPTNIVLTAMASDAYGTVANVQFFADEVSLGSRSTAPYTIIWSNAPAGAHTLRAVATDDSGGTNTSAAITVEVLAPQPTLQIAYGFNRIFLTWPESSPDVRVETTTNVAAPVMWAPFPSAPFLQDGLFQVVVPLDPHEPQRFFRLATP